MPAPVLPSVSGSSEVAAVEAVPRRVRWAAAVAAGLALAVGAARGADGALVHPLAAALVVLAGTAVVDRVARRARSLSWPSVVQVAGDAAMVLVVAAGLGVGGPGGLWLLVPLAVVAAEACRLVGAQLARQRRVAERAARRADLLGVTAAAGSAIASLEPDRVLASVVDTVVALGFDAVHISVLEDGRAWRVAAASDARRPLVGRRRPADEGVAGRVRRLAGTVVARDTAPTPDERAWLDAAACRTVVATPVWVDGEMVAVLEAGERIGRPVTADELECVELLAAQAGSALANARRFHGRGPGASALHDPATGLPNRLLLVDRLDHALAASGRTGAPVALATLEIDGADRGDAMLPALARRLASALRPADTVAVTGADRLAVLAGGLVGLDDVVRLMDRLMAEVRPARVSAGVALGRSGAVSSAHLLRQADLAARRAREAGGDRYEIFDAPVHLRLSEAGELHDTLRRVVERW